MTFCAGEAYGDSFGRRRLFLAVFLSLFCHAAVLTSFRYLAVGAFVRDGAKPLPLRVELNGPERPVSVDASTSEGDAREQANTAQPTELAISEKGKSNAGGDGEGVASDSGDSSGKTRSATITREVAPVYYSAEMLGRRPIPLHAVAPNYPAGVEGVSGKVTLVLFISEKGAVDNAAILSSNLPVAFEDEARLAFSQARYAPGLIAGKPVGAKFVVEVRFEAGGSSSVSPQ